MYTGREGGRLEQGLAARVVRDLTGTLEEDNHEVYMDNFLSSVNPFEERLKKNVLCCGTLRTNRKGCPEVLKGKEVVRKQGETMQKGRLTAYARYDEADNLPVYLCRYDVETGRRRTSTALPLLRGTTQTWVEWIEQIKCALPIHHPGRAENGGSTFSGSCLTRHW